MKKLLIALASAIVCAIATVLVVGWLTPRDHVVSRSLVVSEPPEVVFDVVTDWSGTAAWRPDVKSVEMLAGEPGETRWREETDDGAITFEEVERDRPRRVVVRIADPDLPFGGTWTWELAPEGKGTRVTVTENGEVKNPAFRFFARFVFGYHTTLERYLQALDEKLGA